MLFRSLFELAIEEGSLDAFKWLKDNGCQWDINISRKAGMWGKMEILKWAIENGCPWNPGEFSAQIQKWALENGWTTTNGIQ